MPTLLHKRPRCTLLTRRQQRSKASQRPACRMGARPLARHHALEGSRAACATPIGSHPAPARLFRWSSVLMTPLCPPHNPGSYPPHALATPLPCVCACVRVRVCGRPKPKRARPYLIECLHFLAHKSVALHHIQNRPNLLSFSADLALESACRRHAIVLPLHSLDLPDLTSAPTAHVP